MRLDIMFDGTHDNLDKYAKMYSVKYVDYDDVVSDILHSFNSDYDLYKFHIALFTAYRSYIDVRSLKVSEFGRGSYDGVGIRSEIISVSPNILAMCLPLYIRKKFFDYDKYLGRFFLKCDLVYHLYN